MNRKLSQARSKTINNKEITSYDHKWCKPSASHPPLKTTEQEIPVRRMDPSNSFKPLSWSFPLQEPSLHWDILEQDNVWTTIRFVGIWKHVKRRFLFHSTRYCSMLGMTLWGTKRVNSEENNQMYQVCLCKSKWKNMVIWIMGHLLDNEDYGAKLNLPVETWKLFKLFVPLSWVLASMET